MSFADYLKNATDTTSTVDVEETESNTEVQVAAYSLDNDVAVYSTIENGWSKPANYNEYKYYEEYSDSSISSVDKNKNITLSSEQINLTQENHSQYIPFEIPRYYDGFDLVNTKITIYWVNSKKAGSEDPVVDVYYNSDKIRFAWLIDSDVTALAGSVEFEIHATGENSQGEEYVWKTKTNKGLTVIQALEIKDFIKPDTTWQTTFLSQVNEAKSAAMNAASEAKDAYEKMKDGVADEVRAEMNNFYTKPEVDEIVESVDISDQLVEYAKSEDVYTKPETDDIVDNNKIDIINDYYVVKIPIENLQISSKNDSGTSAKYADIYYSDEITVYNGVLALVNPTIISNPNYNSVKSVIEGKYLHTITDSGTTNSYYKIPINADITYPGSSEPVSYSVVYIDKAYQLVLKKYATENYVKTSISDSETNVKDYVANNYALKTDIPTKISAFSNDVGYLTEHQSLDGYATEDYVRAEVEKVDVSGELQSYVKTVDMKTELAKKSDVGHTHVLEDITDYKAPDLSNYATKSELADAVASVDVSEQLKEYAKTSDVYTKEEVYTKDEVNSVIADIDVSDQLDNYYTKTEIDNKETVLSSNVSSNTTKITSISEALTDLQTTVNGIDTSPRLTYDFEYNDPENPEVGENGFAVYEIQNEGKDNEVKSLKKKFTIVGGSGGGATSSTLKIEYITKTPYVATVNDKIIIKYNFSGTDSSGDDVLEGNYTWKVGNSIVATGIAVSGENSFDITDYIAIGTQKVILSITDDAGSLVTKTWTIQKIDVRIESTFNDQLTYPMGTISFDYTPYGAVSKDVHFILDGAELGTITTTSSGIPMSYTLPSQAHGAHLLESYITTEINSNTIESNHILKDIIWWDDSSELPVISCTQQKITAKQYDTTNITYTVYDPRTETPTVILSVDDNVVSTQVLNTNTQVWQFKSADIGEHTLTIKCRDVVKTITLTIEKLDIDVEPITANLVFDFSPTGKTNNDTDRLWTDGTTSMTVSDNFDWTNGGYQLDDNGDQYFCIKAGTTAIIDYNLFADDARKNGKEFKIIFKTTNVSKSNATFLTCMSNDSTKTGLQMNVHEAYIRSSLKELYVPYSEEDIIELDFNVIKDTDIPIVMTYEDGTPYRPMSYTSDHTFTQSTPVPITIGSPDCDVHIYRIKAYSASLTNKAILSNFIADARNADDMIDRYNQNQIYDENNNLTPESIAKSHPNVKVLKVDCPHFTNDKKDFVINTNIECIHTGGDPVYDNWKAINCAHSGRTNLAPCIWKHIHKNCGRKLEC